jgi:hypothetical protein
MALTAISMSPVGGSQLGWVVCPVFDAGHRLMADRASSKIMLARRIYGRKGGSFRPSAGNGPDRNLCHLAAAESLIRTPTWPWYSRSSTSI